ncbi:MAG TPA: hypothetical protein VL633_00565 [Bacteroidota bacterium]|jgi:hypothetical protein|nr:hypothetical protein [Bacteroidota bacterium]
MSGKALIIVVTGIIIVTSVILTTIGATSMRIVENVGQYYSRQSAQNIAQSGVNLAIRRLVNDQTWRANGAPWELNMLGGKASIRAFDGSFDGVSAVCIQSIGIEDYHTSLERRDTSTAWAWVPPVVVPTWSKALLTLSGVNHVNGNITIDGRDFDSFSDIVNPGNGSWGIWSTASTFIQQGSPSVGGTTEEGVDVAPTGNPQDTIVIRLNQPYPGGFPTSPDSAFGYTEGTLKALARSGFAGSQYVVDPAKLSSPFSGVTYVELPAGGIWNAGGIVGTGILIIHNSAHDAVLKNPNSGSANGMTGFSGILLADDIVHLHLDFWGAILLLSPYPQGNVLGNGDAYLHYSRMAMKNAVGALKNGSQVKILAWYE